MTTKGPATAAAAVLSGTLSTTASTPKAPTPSLSSEPTVNLEGLDPKLLKTSKIHTVELDSLVLLKIIKHCRDTYPEVGNGQLLGLDIAGVLSITNCFAFTKNVDFDTDTDDFGAEYQLQILKNMRRLGYDANTVGWYQTAYLGSFWNQSPIETQYNYQKSFPQAVHLVYDPTRTQQGNLSVKAMRLTDKFMKMYSEKKFTLESCVKQKMTPSMIFENVPVVVKNSKLAEAALFELEESPLYSIGAANAAKGRDAALSTFSTRNVGSGINRFHPNEECLELEMESYLEKHLEYLGDTIEEHGQEQWRWQLWQRNVAKEQQKLKVAASKGDEGIETMMVNMQKLVASEPSRLETLIITKQVETYAKQINQFAGPSLSKMFMTRGLQD